MGITFPSFCYHENTYCIQTCSTFTSSLLDEAMTPNWGGGGGGGDIQDMEKRASQSYQEYLFHLSSSPGDDAQR